MRVFEEDVGITVCMLLCILVVENTFFSYRFIPDAMASQKVKVRLVADPSISVSDLVQCFECWIDENVVTKDVLAW